MLYAGLKVHGDGTYIPKNSKIPQGWRSYEGPNVDI